MGFGSYDESEQQRQNASSDDDAEGVNVHANDHDGEMSFEPNASTEDLVAKLGEMKDSED